MYLNLTQGSREEYGSSYETYEKHIAYLASQKCNVIAIEGAPPFMLLGPAREAEMAPLARDLGRDVGCSGGRIDNSRHRHGHLRRLRHSRLKERDRPLDDAEDHPLGSQRATEHQRELPGDVEQLIVGIGIVGRAHDPVIKGGEMSQRPRDIGDLMRDVADLFGHRQQELRAEAVRLELDR